MNTAFVKSVVAGGTGIFASITAFFYGYANVMLLTFLGVFILTLAIQYSILKIKIIIPLLASLGFMYYFLNSFGIGIDNLLNILNITSDIPTI